MSQVQGWFLRSTLYVETMVSKVYDIITRSMQNMFWASVCPLLSSLQLSGTFTHKLPKSFSMSPSGQPCFPLFSSLDSGLIASLLSSLYLDLSMSKPTALPSLQLFYGSRSLLLQSLYCLRWLSSVVNSLCLFFSRTLSNI